MSAESEAGLDHDINSVVQIRQFSNAAGVRQVEE